MKTCIFITLATILSLSQETAAIQCHRCVYMETSDGKKYGESFCEKDGLDFVEKDTTREICTRDLNLRQNEAYYNEQKPWSAILPSDEGTDYADWLCQKSRFTLKSSASSKKIDVWYRGCQPISTTPRCTSKLETNLRDISEFKGIYADLTGTEASRVSIEDGDECICEEFQCNSAQANLASLLAMCVTIATLFLVILI